MILHSFVRFSAWHLMQVKLLLAYFTWRTCLLLSDPGPRTKTSPRLGFLGVREGLLREGDVGFSGIGGPIPDASVSPQRPPVGEDGS